LIVQAEGEKQWHVCKKMVPGSPERDVKGRANLDHMFLHEERDSLECELIVLAPGDVLYMPHGTIHEAEMPAIDGGKRGDTASLSLPYSTHITLSVQRYGARFRQKRTLDDVIGSHTCSV
jgi:hypothetical protein